MRDVKALLELSKGISSREELLKNVAETTAEYARLAQRSENIARFLEISKDVERKVLEQTVAILNSEMERFLNVMFTTHPIKVEFSTTRKLKSKAGVSAQCSVRIFYKNVEYDDPEELSGGEGDRLSLAMMMALNYISDSGICILDETLSTLDATLKISVIEMMQEFCGKSKVAVVISHEGVEGVYSNVLDLDLKP